MWLEESGSSNFCFKGKREDERKRARIGLGFCLLIFFLHDAGELHSGLVPRQGLTHADGCVSSRSSIPSIFREFSPHMWMCQCIFSTCTQICFLCLMKSADRG